jgi:tellurite methyltransferase
MSGNHSPLLTHYADQIAAVANKGAILDLACGGGRNGLHLVEQGIPVVFADSDPTALAQVERSLAAAAYSYGRDLAALWQVDLEQGQLDPLEGRRFAGIIVYRYLYRAMFDAIKQAVHPGGIVIYETFTIDQPRYGRPKNPEFLLEHGELQACFSDWNILHSFEGVEQDDKGVDCRAIAQIVAIKRR